MPPAALAGAPQHNRTQAYTHPYPLSSKCSHGAGRAYAALANLCRYTSGKPKHPTKAPPTSPTQTYRHCLQPGLSEYPPRTRRPCMNTTVQVGGVALSPAAFLVLHEASSAPGDEAVVAELMEACVLSDLSTVMEEGAARLDNACGRLLAERLAMYPGIDASRLAAWSEYVAAVRERALQTFTMVQAATAAARRN